MTINAPLLDGRDADKIADQVEEALADYGWQGKEGGAGRALVRLFARLSELVINRLNQVPEKHFLAFLNEAGIDLLPPRPAGGELSFKPAKDAPASISVPAGTQVATVQTETQPEVVFETQRDITVVPDTLVKCIAFDELNYSDQTAKATGREPGSFAVFQGEHERRRILYIGDDNLFFFADEVSRKAATVILEFEFASPGNFVEEGWSLEWLYWDGTEWAGLMENDAAVNDETQKFSRNGRVTLENIPELTGCAVGEENSLWIACELTGGSRRRKLPVLSSVKGKRTIEVTEKAPVNLAPDSLFSAIHSGTSFVPLDPSGEFSPLGRSPSVLDAFYVQCDEAFNKKGAAFRLLIDVETDPRILSDDLEGPTVKWEYSSVNGWSLLGTSTRSSSGSASSQINFKDTTGAFTHTTATGAVSFNVPEDAAKIRVNDTEGYWVRAKLAGGSYDRPGSMTVVTENGNTTCKWIKHEIYPPLIKKIGVQITGYSDETEGLETISGCRSEVDCRNLDHSENLANGLPFSPFGAADEGPALYLGFKQAFPAGKWIQMLLDIEEKSRTDKKRTQIFWEYWNGTKWLALRVSDGTRGLSQREYLGFFGPDNHQPCAWFGQDACWLRARPHMPPLADAGSDHEIRAMDNGITVNLDGSGSRSFDRQVRIAGYTWRKVLSADAGNDQEKYTNDDRVTMTLDASASTPEERIVKYIWRMAGRENQEKPEHGTTVSSPLLKVIRLNTVPAVNTVTIGNETLGSSDGKSGQVFTLLHPPVLSDAQIAVLEPDRPSDNELEQLRKELEKVDKSARAILSEQDAGSGKGVWVRWHQVEDFYASGPADRHFILDPIGGHVIFGNDKRGKIPPVGHDNVQAVRYRSHHGGKGNAAAGVITVLRNPIGDLAAIKSVTNHEKAGGGSDAETIDEVRLRGPQRLKHRRRAVTVEDFEWLAREAGGEVGQARCLPTRNRSGLPEAGWVTVVILPKSNDAKPMPSPALLRCVETYLKNRALTNLKNIDHINVKGPEYIEATVIAEVVPGEPEKSDDVELAILKRLETFLHPLRGGPDRSGWELGRDVFISEVYAEIEAVSGVDHVEKVRLLTSQQQCVLHLSPEDGDFRKIPFDIPMGSRVSTFDERIRLVLAGSVLMKKSKLKRLDVYGFKAGDHVDVVSADNSVLKGGLTIASLVDDKIEFVESFDLPAAPDSPADALLTADKRIRLPLAQNGIIKIDGRITGVTVHVLSAGDKVSVVAGTRRDPLLEFLPVEEVNICEDRIFVPEGHLVYSGNHDIEMILE